jgi:hypothetical protein
MAFPESMSRLRNATSCTRVVPFLVCSVKKNFVYLSRPSVPAFNVVEGGPGTAQNVKMQPEREGNQSNQSMQISPHSAGGLILDIPTILSRHYVLFAFHVEARIPVQLSLRLSALYLARVASHRSGRGSGTVCHFHRVTAERAEAFGIADDITYVLRTHTST